MINYKRSSASLGFNILALIFFLGISVSHAYEPTRSVDISDPATLQVLEQGEELFKANCASCHAVGKKLIGPDLANSWDRWSSEENLIAWIRNNVAFLETGDPYAVALYAEYNESPMNIFLQLTEEDVLSIIDYTIAKTEGTFPLKLADETAEISSEPAGGNSPVILWALVIFLVMVFLLLWRVSGRLNALSLEKQGEDVPAETPLIQRILSKKTFSAIALICVLFIGANVVKGAVELGRSQGYAPVQPIKFSHALHAGEGNNNIECKYCHSGADKSKHAVIPSVTVCMNCHKYVQEGPKYGTEEIAKIYDYAGWDSEELAFTENADPIKWVKVHNLPDHVFFSHAQHVSAGGLDCETCHGNVGQMEVIAQFAPLSMGWCVNCHRGTNVKFNGNEYYETTFERFHNELEMGERSGVTVEDIGGAECQKCHY